MQIKTAKLFISFTISMLKLHIEKKKYCKEGNFETV